MTQPAAAQADTDSPAAISVLRGSVRDAADAPVPHVVVVLHAVSEQAGVEVDRDSAGADGEFTLSWRPEPDAVYFVATRLDGGIYMAEPFREPPTSAIVLRAGAGVEPIRLSGLQSQPGTPPRGIAPVAPGSSHAGWWVALIATVVVGFVAWLLHRARRRPTRVRELLVDIARLDENHERAGDAASDAAYDERREALRGRLLEAIELDHDADRY